MIFATLWPRCFPINTDIDVGAERVVTKLLDVDKPLMLHISHIINMDNIAATKVRNTFN